MLALLFAVTVASAAHVHRQCEIRIGDVFAGTFANGDHVSFTYGGGNGVVAHNSKSMHTMFMSQKFDAELNHVHVHTANCPGEFDCASGEVSGDGGHYTVEWSKDCSCMTLHHGDGGDSCQARSALLHGASVTLATPAHKPIYVKDKVVSSTSDSDDDDSSSSDDDDDNHVAAGDKAHTGNDDDDDDDDGSNDDDSTVGDDDDHVKGDHDHDDDDDDSSNSDDDDDSTTTERLEDDSSFNTKHTNEDYNRDDDDDSSDWSDDDDDALNKHDYELYDLDDDDDDGTTSVSHTSSSTSDDDSDDDDDDSSHHGSDDDDDAHHAAIHAC